MNLTQQQLTALKTEIYADPALVALVSTGAYSDVKDALNKPSSPAFIVWRTSVSVDEIMRNGMDWARVDNLSVGKARIWDWMSHLGSFDTSKPNIRAGIDATWVGTAADLAVRAVVYTHCKRTATRAERVLATGAGSDAVPGNMTAEGELTTEDVERVLTQG